MVAVLSMLTQERHANDLSRGHRFFLLVLVSIGSSIIYTPVYLQYVFEDPLGKALIASSTDATSRLRTVPPWSPTI